MYKTIRTQLPAGHRAGCPWKTATLHNSIQELIRYITAMQAIDCCYHKIYYSTVNGGTDCKMNKTIHNKQNYTIISLKKCSKGNSHKNCIPENCHE
jgi:hypothetical protein